MAEEPKNETPGDAALVSPHDDEDGICQCESCRMGYPCEIAHRRFFAGEGDDDA